MDKAEMRVPARTGKLERAESGSDVKAAWVCPLSFSEVIVREPFPIGSVRRCANVDFDGCVDIVAATISLAAVCASWGDCQITAGPDRARLSSLHRSLAFPEPGSDRKVSRKYGPGRTRQHRSRVAFPLPEVIQIP